MKSHHRVSIGNKAARQFRLEQAAGFRTCFLKKFGGSSLWNFLLGKALPIIETRGYCK